MGLDTTAQLLDAQLEISLHNQQTYIRFSSRILTVYQQGVVSRALNFKFFEFGGMAAYPIYLNQALFIAFAKNFQQIFHFRHHIFGI